MVVSLADYENVKRYCVQSSCLVMLLALFFCSMAVAETLPTLRTETGTVPWTPSPDANTEKVIYGTDDRIDVYQETNTARASWAASTCAIVYASELTDQGDGTYKLSAYTYNVYGLDACAGEPFASQPTAPFCTGFMVGPNLIATAGHCVEESDLSRIYFLFGFDMKNASTPVLTFKSNQVYTGTKIVHHGGTGDRDHAIVRVDRAITAPGAFSLPLRRVGTLSVGDAVGVIGHPSGLPKKIAFGASTVVRNTSAEAYFMANLDTYGGNSGSPVFNAVSGLVEGILVRGAQDFVSDGSCFRSNTLSDTGGTGEGVTRSSVFTPYVPEVFVAEGESEGEDFEGELGEGELYEGEDFEGEVFEGEYEPDEGEEVWLMVPNLSNLTLDTASTKLEERGFVLGTVTEKHNDTVPKDRIISQNPEAGTLASPESAVTVVVSLGPEYLSVPNLSATDLAEAEAALLEAGLVLGAVDEEYDPTVIVRHVIRQEPEAGSLVSPESAVTVVVSLGPEVLAVPNLVGKDLAEAEAALLEAGLALGVVGEEYDPTMSLGHVIRQDPLAGKEIERDSEVAITLSLGPEPVAGEDEMPAGCHRKLFSPDSSAKTIQRVLGDWLLIGLALLTLFAFAETTKGL